LIHPHQHKEVKMPAKHSLKTVRLLADNAEQESSRLVAQRRQQLDAAQHQLMQLKRYADEYQQPGSGQGMYIDTVRTRAEFIARIRSGIEQQERLIAGLEQQLELDMQRWRTARSHALGLQRYAERQAQQEELRQNRKEQAKQDEIGQTMHYRAAG
jgi:flagellar export protein FliJ